MPPQPTPGNWQNINQPGSGGFYNGLNSLPYGLTNVNYGTPGITYGSLLLPGYVLPNPSSPFVGTTPHNGNFGPSNTL